MFGLKDKSPLSYNVFETVNIIIMLVLGNYRNCFKTYVFSAILNIMFISVSNVYKNVSYIQLN